MTFSAFTILAPEDCDCDSSRAARLPGDTIASVWECDTCGDLRPFSEADYAFCNAQRWLPRAPEGVERLTWLLTPTEDKYAHYARA